jgi:hypothetical protein
MSRRFFLLLGLMVAIALPAGCGESNGSGTAQPAFEAPLDADDSRPVYAPTEEQVPQEEAAPQGSITIEGVQVTAGKQVVVHGTSTLPDGTCLGSELWADGELQPWWPGDDCVVVENGAWQRVVRLGSDGTPAELDPAAQYMLRVFQQNGPNIVAVFPFDLSGPPPPMP